MDVGLAKKIPAGHKYVSNWRGVTALVKRFSLCRCLVVVVVAKKVPLLQSLAIPNQQQPQQCGSVGCHDQLLLLLLAHVSSRLVILISDFLHCTYRENVSAWGTCPLEVSPCPHAWAEVATRCMEMAAMWRAKRSITYTVYCLFICMFTCFKSTIFNK